jgi:hypothetical protein
MLRGAVVCFSCMQHVPPSVLSDLDLYTAACLAGSESEHWARACAAAVAAARQGQERQTALHNRHLAIAGR